jgi:hypothetical protein
MISTAFDGDRSMRSTSIPLAANVVEQRGPA